ncbi:MAG: type II toxin-antitoxin system Phd/YefM family antitoxin [Clostridia bacterium]|nr:type II toxin-antitoxin system Phd/YefM family antitoxin [Clostridia bacterium]
MPDMTNAITNTISISMFNRGLAGQVFEDVKRSGAKVVMKNNTAECVLLSPEEYVKLMDEVNDARLLALATERMENFDASNAVSETDVLKELEINADDISDAEKVEIE